MVSSTTIDGDNSTVDSSLLVPTSTSTDPDGTLQEFLTMLIEVCGGGLGNLNGLDGFGLHLRDGFVDVDCYDLHRQNQGPIGDW